MSILDSSISVVHCDDFLFAPAMGLDDIYGLNHTDEDEAWLAAQSEGGCHIADLSPEEIAFLALACAWEPDAEFDAWVDANYADRHDAFIGGLES